MSGVGGLSFVKFCLLLFCIVDDTFGRNTDSGEKVDVGITISSSNTTEPIVEGSVVGSVVVVVVGVVVVVVVVVVIVLLVVCI
jgi:hypothetical protein